LHTGIAVDWDQLVRGAHNEGPMSISDRMLLDRDLARPLGRASHEGVSLFDTSISLWALSLLGPSTLRVGVFGSLQTLKEFGLV
jgi:hypothetical protein